MLAPADAPQPLPCSYSPRPLRPPQVPPAGPAPRDPLAFCLPLWNTLLWSVAPRPRPDGPGPGPSGPRSASAALSDNASASRRNSACERGSPPDAGRKVAASLKCLHQSRSNAISQEPRQPGATQLASHVVQNSTAGTAAATCKTQPGSNSELAELQASGRASRNTAPGMTCKLTKQCGQGGDHAREDTDLCSCSSHFREPRPSANSLAVACGSMYSHTFWLSGIGCTLR